MRFTTAAAMLLGMSACGGSDVRQEYQDLLQQVGDVVATHRQNAQVMTTRAQCDVEMPRYDADVRPKVQRMRELSGTIDARCGGMMGGGMSGRSGASRGCGSMMDELDRHDRNACTSSVDDNRSEASRHCSAMDGYIGDEESRMHSCRWF